MITNSSGLKSVVQGHFQNPEIRKVLINLSQMSTSEVP